MKKLEGESAGPKTPRSGVQSSEAAGWGRKTEKYLWKKSKKPSKDKKLRGRGKVKENITPLLNEKVEGFGGKLPTGAESRGRVTLPSFKELPWRKTKKGGKRTRAGKEKKKKKGSRRLEGKTKVKTLKTMA